MSYHEAPDVNDAIINLLDCLCQWERMTGIGSLLILAPDVENKVILAQDGKPIESSEFYFDHFVTQIKGKVWR